MAQPVLSLPVEILSQIFLYLSIIHPCVCAPSQNGSSEKRIPDLKRLGWFPPVTQTCRTWRRVALGYPDLWARNLCSFRSQQATKCFFERAKDSCNLIFAAKYHGIPLELSQYQVRLALKNIGRVKAFEQGSNGYLPAFFAHDLCAKPWPHLTLLQLHRWPNAGRTFVIDAVTLDAPALRELVLDGVFFRINTPALRSLTVGNSAHRSLPVSTSVLLSALRSVPLLNHLKFDNIFSPRDAVSEDNQDSSTASNTPDIDLPHLQSLRFGMADGDLRLYRRINSPSNIAVRIKDIDCLPHVYLADMLSTLQRHLCDPAHNTLLVFEQNASSGIYINIVLRSSAFAPILYTDNNEPDFRLTIFVHQSSPQRLSSMDIVQMLAPFIETKNIKFLDIGDTGADTYMRFECRDLKETFALFPNMTTVQMNVDESVRSTHLDALYVRSPHDDDDDGPSYNWGAKHDASPEEENDEEDESYQGEDSQVGDDGSDQEEESELEEQNQGEESELENSDTDAAGLPTPLPMLQHLVVQGMYDHDNSNEFFESAWDVVIAALEERSRIGHPVRFLTLCDRERMRDEDSVRLDRQGKRRAKALVEKVFDKRGWAGEVRPGPGVESVWRGRISEYVQDL